MSKILLFDGVCNLCDSTVQFVIKRDPHAQFRFASLQSEKGQQLIQQYGIANDLNSFILIDQDRCYSKSSAALRVMKNIKGPWRLLYGLIIVPRPIRDAGYDLIAKNRYKWFGKKEQCMLPSPDIRERFLE